MATFSSQIGCSCISHMVASCHSLRYGSHMNTTTETAYLVAKAIEAAERSQKWTADKAGMSPATLRRKVNGGADFTVGELERIAKALGVAPRTLLPPAFRLKEAA